MIKKIVVKNVYTFSEKIIFDFNSKESIYAIFGGNGVGKTNIISTFRMINKSLKGEIEFSDIKKMKSKFIEEDLMQFLVRYDIDNINYDYSLILDIDKVIFQSIVADGKVILQYDGEKEIKYTSDVLDIEKFENFDASIKGFMPLLSLFTDESILPLTRYIERNFADNRKYGDMKNRQSLLKFVYENKEVIDILTQEIKKIDVGISDLKIRLNQDDGTYIVNFIHNDISMDLQDESSGTRKYFHLMLNLLFDLKKFNSNIYMIDELESSFHPLLTKYFIQYFKNHPEVQFIFTTHNYDILDEKLLPDKSIYFLQKEDNHSSLFCLSDFNLRKDDRNNWKKMYFQNRMGGVPRVEIRS